MFQDVGAWAAIARGRSREEFLAVAAYPVLVIEPFVVSDEDSFTTGVGRCGPGQGLSVADIKKQPGSNAFASMITIGRAKNNDLVLPALAVSKFHAYVLVPRDGSPPLLTDAGSSNGTRVNGVQLVPKVDRKPLLPGTTVEFGELKATFQDPPGLWDFLRSLMNQKTT